MKTIHFVSLVSLSVVAASSARPALALDVAPGADALYSQVRESKLIGVAVLEAATPDKLTFKTQQSIEGKLPDVVEVPSDAYIETLKLARGRSYLIFLRPADGKGPQLRLSVSMYSVLPAEQAEAGAYKDAVAIFRKAVNDKAGAREPLLKLLDDARLPYIQYSAAQGLRQLRLLQKSDLPAVQRALMRPGGLDARAQEVLLRDAERLGGVEPKVLEQLIKSPRTALNVKSISVDALFRAKGADGIKPVLEEIDKSSSLRLKRQAAGLLSKQPPAAAPEDRQ